MDWGNTSQQRKEGETKAKVGGFGEMISMGIGWVGLKKNNTTEKRTKTRVGGFGEGIQGLRGQVLGWGRDRHNHFLDLFWVEILQLINDDCFIRWFYSL